MESVIEGHSNETISLAVDGLVWNGASPANNQNILYIAVEYIKDNEFKIDSDTSLSPQNVYNELEQHVSPLDPNMSSVAQYSPVYASDSPVSYSNPIVVTQLVANNNNNSNNNNNNETAASLSLPNNSSELGQVVSTKYLQMINDQSPNESSLQTSSISQNIDSEQEVELLITDQNTGISYSVSTQEYLVERCLADDQHLLENLSTETLLDSDLLALDENALKSSLSEIIVDPTNQKTQTNAQPLLENIKHETSESSDVRRSSRNISCDDIEIEEKFLSQVQSIIDKPVPTRAWATLPESFLTINKLPSGDNGIFARKLINKFVQFGPLEGVYRRDDFKVEENKLELFIGVSNGHVVRLDTSDESTSNWMCFVRRALTYEEQNIVLIQQENSLYYITKDYINPKQELKVGYSRAYAQRYNLPVLEPILTENNAYQCFECSEKFFTSEQLQKHLDIHDSDNAAAKSRRKKKKLLKPEFVDCGPGNVNNFTKGIVKHTFNRDGTGIKRWSCTFIDCNAAFNEESLLNKHYTKAHSTTDRKTAGGDSFICNHCNEKLTSEDELRHHISTIHAAAQKKKKCPVCYKVFASIDRVQSHMLVHGSEESKPLKCDKCNKRFLNNSALACHFKTHMLGRKQFECPICREMFDYVLQLKLHVHHHCKNGQYTCPHCEKPFFKYSIIRKHIRAFHCEKRHSCPNCSKHFPTLDKLRMHLLKHSDHREFLCADCGKQFKRKDKLKEHCKRMHSEERENAVPKQKVTNVQSSKKFIPKVQPTDYHRFIYKCHSCLVGFKRRGMLVNHLAKRHPDISPHSVPELNLPILRTTRDYYCQYCEKVYKSSSKRKAHILKNHPGSALPLSNRRHASTSDLPNPTFSQTVGSITTHPQSCQWCHKQYASKAKLLQHQRKKHLELLQTQNDSELKQRFNEAGVPTKISPEDLLAHVGPDCHLVSVESYQANDSDLRLYRLLTTTNNLAPPR